MATPLDRATILDEARRQFARRGFAKTSLSDIVAPLGVGKTAIYHHFPGGKQELVDACLRREEEVVFDRMRHAIESHQDPRDQLRAVVLAKMEALGGLRVALGISTEVGRELIQLYQQHRRRFTEYEELLLKSVICRGQAARIFRPADAGRLAHALRVNLQVLEVPLAFEMKPTLMREHVDLILDLVFNGLVSPSQRRSARLRPATVPAQAPGATPRLSS